jgi:hypothetical protein
MSTSTTLGGFRLGLAIANFEAREVSRVANAPLPPPAWRWQIRRLGSTHPCTAFDVPLEDDACCDAHKARAWRMLQAAVTEQ